MWKYILTLLGVANDEFFPGVVGRGDDTNLYNQSEVVASFAQPQFTVKTEKEIRSFPYQYQGTKSACVAYTIAKIATVLYFMEIGRIVKFSPTPIYSQRLNKPGLGMIFTNARELASKYLVADAFLPSDELSEEEMTNYKIDEKIINTGDGFALSPDWIEMDKDFDTVAATMQITGKPTMLWFYFGPKEFFGLKIPRAVLRVFSWWRHSVTGVDTYKTADSGIEYIRIEDSADKEHLYKKDITREFFNDRILLAAYPQRFKYDKDMAKPVYNGTIVSVQKCLVYEGFMPTATAFAENVGPLTQAGLRKFQQAKGFAVTGTISAEVKEYLLKLYK